MYKTMLDAIRLEIIENNSNYKQNATDKTFLFFSKLVGFATGTTVYRRLI